MILPAPPSLQAPAPPEATPLFAQAVALLQRPGAAEERGGRAVDLLHRRLAWTSTDYRTRTVEEILARGQGNCADHAKVLQACLDAGGFRSRWVQEINLQPPSEARRATAQEKVRASGPRYSVFGYRHNDHRWLEVWDPEHRTWFPADSSVGVTGLAEWVQARLGFGPRPEAIADLIAPVFVEAVAGPGQREPRTEAYLVDAFGAAEGGRIRRLPGWPAWVEAVRALEAPAARAFRGEEDLHPLEPRFEALAEAYVRLRAQASRP